MYDKLYKLLTEHEKERDFTHIPASDADIENAEKRLGVKFPDDYIWFLKNFGAGGVAGIEVYGLVKGGLVCCDIFKYTLECREEYNLPHSFVIICNQDEWFDCIDTDTGAIVMWSMFDDDIVPCAGSFEEYMLEESQEAINNDDDDAYCRGGAIAPEEDTSGWLKRLNDLLDDEDD